MSAEALAPLLLEAVALKALDRAGWRRVGLEPVESVAAHSWGVAWLVALCCPPALNRERALLLALVHDLPEVRVGDITPADGVPKAEKHRLERAAADAMLAHQPELLSAWAEYAAQQTAEARFVHELDRLDMGLQALAEQRRPGAPDLSEFLVSADRAIHTEALRLIWSAAQRVAGA